MHKSLVIEFNFFWSKGYDKKIFNYLLKDYMQIIRYVKEGRDFIGPEIQELQMWIHSFL